MKRTAAIRTGLSSIALVIAGCATGASDVARGPDPYSAAVYTGAGQPDAADLYAGLRAPTQWSDNGAPFELVSYAGIEGARRAHERYAKHVAEALDGRCEREVKPTKTESLIDIADLCDVPLDMLVEFNPGVADISYSTAGATVQVPGGIESPQGFAAASDALVELSAVMEGDTLEKIAYRLNVSQSAIANLNPDIDWTNPVAGQMYLKPAALPQQATTAAPAPAPAWEGYAGGQGIAGSPAAGSGGASAHAPYALGPVKSLARPEGVFPKSTLEVDRRFVKAGDSVKVTATAKPGAEVTFYSGEGPEALEKAKTVLADKNGMASASITVPKKSSMGGVVFGARAEGSRNTQFSDRVTVIRLKEKADDPSADKKSEND